MIGHLSNKGLQREAPRAQSLDLFDGIVMPDSSLCGSMQMKWTDFNLLRNASRDGLQMVEPSARQRAS